MNPILETDEQRKFFNSLTDFLVNTNRIKPGHKQKFQEISQDFYPLKLYKLVCRRGGFQAVTNRKQWAEIALDLYIRDLPKLKDFYFLYLYPYEQKYYFGKDTENDLPNMICGNPRKMVKVDPTSTNQTQNQQNLQQSQHSANPQQNPPQKNLRQQSHCLQEEINKKFQEQERQRKIFFLNKNKLNQTKAQIKKIIMGLQSFMEKRDINYSLNMLILYSINTHFPFLFESNQKIFTVLSSFTQTIYPPKNQEEMEHLRTVLTIWRNFTMSPINLKFILGTEIFELFVKIFNEGLDKECSKNVIDIMTGLVKVGWNCQRIMINLEAAVSDEQIDIIQSSVDLLRGLVDEREQAMFTVVPENVKVFNRILMSNKISTQVKEQVFEILAFVTDASQEARELIAKNFALMGIIIGVLQHMTYQGKLTRLAALTLNNISNAMSGKSLIKEFESELVVIGFSDDSLAGIVANILADIATL